MPDPVNQHADGWNKRIRAVGLAFIVAFAAVGIGLACAAFDGDLPPVAVLTYALGSVMMYAFVESVVNMVDEDVGE